jgi:hypothetical protein
MAASFFGVAICRPRRQEGGLEPPLPHSSLLAGPKRRSVSRVTHSLSITKQAADCPLQARGEPDNHLKLTKL